MKQPSNSERSRRFNSERSANDFSSQVNGNVRDLRSNDNRSSDFKVTYTKGDAKNRDFSKGSNPKHKE